MRRITLADGSGCGAGRGSRYDFRVQGKFISPGVIEGEITCGDDDHKEVWRKWQAVLWDRNEPRIRDKLLRLVRDPNQTACIRADAAEHLWLWFKGDTTLADEIAPLMSTEDKEVAVAVARAILSILGDEKAVLFFGGMVRDDPNPVSAHRAAVVLGNLGNKAKPAKPFLKQALSRKEAVVTDSIKNTVSRIDRN